MQRPFLNIPFRSYSPRATMPPAALSSLTPSPTAPPADYPSAGLSHLQLLEAESIHILREVASEFERPVMLYSIGKDSPR